MHLLVKNITNSATERINIRSTVDAKNVIEQAENLLDLSVSFLCCNPPLNEQKTYLNLIMS